MKRQKGMTLDDEVPRSEGVQHATTGEEWKAITNNSRKNEVAGPSGNHAQLWIYLMVKVKVQC